MTLNSFRILDAFIKDQDPGGWGSEGELGFWGFQNMILFYKAYF